MCNRRKGSQDVCLLTERGHRMALLELILVFALQCDGISVDCTSLYYRAGYEAVLSCTTPVSSDTTCPNTKWLYNRVSSQTIVEVQKGEVVKGSVRAARLSLNTHCSLVINNVTAEDAGSYTCRQGGDLATDVSTYLSVLTISPSLPDADPKRDGKVTLECSLDRYRELSPCQPNSVRWVDETRTALLGKGVGYEFITQTNCVSILTVKHQRGRNRKYTCQFVENEDDVKIETDYTPIFTDNKHINIVIGAVVGVVVGVVLVVIAAVLIKYRKRAHVTEDAQKPVHHPDELEGNLTYVAVRYDNQKASPNEKIKEDETVIYSAIKTPVKTEAENNPNNRCVSAPQ